MEPNIQQIKPNREKALLLCKRQLPELVWDAVNLEGLHFTLPEVQTLLDGVTVGGHRLLDQTIALNQAKAWEQLFAWVQQDTFELTVEKVCALHAIAGQEEALQWGRFRDSQVTIAGTDYLPPKADQLPQRWEALLEELQAIDGVYEQAIAVFLLMARNQFFFDVNKRMGRFMMNGLLLSQGYPAINLPAKRQLEFNTLMLDFYSSGERAPMTAFMVDCLDPVTLAIMSE